MRLTLRTLLAYLDDSLSPADTLQMSAKIAESDRARDIVREIKRLERRRSLPPIEPDSYAAAEDANAIGCYLDNVLPPDDLEGLEKILIESPVLMHEVSTSHQILTVVLGEPAKVPPAAYDRMYNLVPAPTGSVRDHEPTHRPAGARDPGAVEVRTDDDDEFLFGLPRLTKAAWNRKRTIVLMAGLAAGLFGALFLAWPKQQQNPSAPAWQPPKPMVVEVVKEVPVAAKKTADEPKTVALAPELAPMPREAEDASKIPDRVPVEAPKGGAGTTGKTADGSPLWTLPTDSRSWGRVGGDASPLPFNQPILCLPGLKSSFMTDAGIKVEMVGSLFELDTPRFLETRLMLHPPIKPLDLDLSLAVGRIFVSRPAQAPASLVRVRLGGEVWDLELLDADSEIAIDRVNLPSASVAGKGEQPQIQAALAVLKGRARVRFDDYRAPDTVVAPSLIVWDSKAGKPGPFKPIAEENLTGWSKTPKPKKGVPADFPSSLQNYASTIRAERGSLAVALNQMMSAPLTGNLMTRAIALQALQAADGLSTLYELLDSDDFNGRELAAACLTYWIAQDAGREAELDTFLAKNKSLGDNTRADVLRLLRPPGPKFADDTQQITGVLDLMAKSEVVSVRELAAKRMEYLFPDGPRFNASDSDANRAGSVSAWKAYLNRKKAK